MKVRVSISWTVSINTTLSVEEYLKKIRPYLKNMMNNFKKSDTWKIEIITINFISSIDDDEQHVIDSKSDNIEIMMSDVADEVLTQLSDSLKNRYQK